MISKATTELAGAEQLQGEHAHPTKSGSRDAHANDPSRTTTIQRKYAQKLRGRFANIRAEIRRGVAGRDIFGLQADNDGEGISLSDILAYDDVPVDVRERFVDLLADQEYDTAGDLVEQLASDFDPEDLVTRDFEFDRLPRKHEEFMSWLRAQQESGVLEVISRDGNTYVRSAYERGWKNANSWMEADSLQSDLATALQRPVHQEKLSLLYARNFEALQGITQDVSREISRELAEGLTEGVHPDEMARRLTDRVDKIGRTRATTLARTEVMYSHNEATITTYERAMGSEVEVQVQTEVSTAGDQHVCEICSPWDGRTLTLKDARRNGPPFHPRCRCIVVPSTSQPDDVGSTERPYAEQPRGDMPEETIEQGVRNSNIVGMDEENIVETFQSGDHGIAITEGTWEYGGLWDSDERVIMIHQNLWSRLDDDARQYLLKHEIYERRRAVAEFGDAIGSTVGQSDAVAAHHTSVNADLLDELGERPLKSYAQATRDKLVAEGTSEVDAIEQAMYRISGAGLEENEVFD